MWENRLFDRLSDVLDGFKEVRLNRPRSDELFEHVVEVSRAAANLKIRTQSETYRRMIFLQTSLYTLLGAVAFVVPVFSDAMGGGTVTKAITALVFIVGACFGLVQSIPIVAAASAAAEKIEVLEAQLQQGGERGRARRRRAARGASARSSSATSSSATSTGSRSARSRSARSTSR